MNRGSLVVVGTGIRTTGQLTIESIAWMRVADKLLYLVADPVAEESIHQLNPGRTESLYQFYSEGKQRLDSYNEMVEHILACVRSGMKTCVAFYGHPGVFVYPSHKAIRQARKEGYNAKMLPGISAEDCLFADLGIDPSTFGCQTYEATDFMVSSRNIDPSSSVILWQIGVVGDWTYKRNGFDLSALPLLLERLYRYYPSDHRVYIYEAAMYIDHPPTIKRLPLHKIRDVLLTASSTLYIPPSKVPPVDYTTWARLGKLTRNVPSDSLSNTRPRRELKSKTK
jgi:uncharacterized protein YabN with tetrapyrrole methylase and pyrophosphatase domain